MGNYISCRNLTTPMMKTARAARVILLGGEIKQFRQPVKAAELMLESPNCFLVNSKYLKIGKRFKALPADEDLEFGNVYIMFPMRRLNSVVTAADMATVLMASNTVARRISGGKIKPVAAGTVDNCLKECEMGRPRLNLDEIEGFQGTEYRCKLVACRSRKPLLDTIVEEPLCSR